MKFLLTGFGLLLIALGPGITAQARGEDTVCIGDWGARAETGYLNTAPIQAAMDHVAAEGGGTVRVPAGTFLTGALFLPQGVDLLLEKDAVLLGSTRLEDYPRQPTRIEGRVQVWRPALINAKGCRGVRIHGEGTLDGNGRPFWRAFWQRRAENRRCTNLEVERPRLLYLEDCDDVLVDGIALRDAGFWNLHLYRCRNVTVSNVTIRAPHGDPPQIAGVDQPWDEISIERAPSSDGIDVDSCQNVTIRGCTFSVGDDCIALKGTKGPLALEDQASPPVEQILVEDCVFESGHGVLTCGSEATLIRNVMVRRCRVGADIPLLRLKLRPDTPQRYENLIFEQIELDGAQAIFDVKPWTQFFDLQGHDPPASVVRNVVVRGLRGSLKSLGELRGNPGDRLDHICLMDVDVTTETRQLLIDPDVGLTCEEVYVDGVAYAGTRKSHCPSRGKDVPAATGE